MVIWLWLVMVAQNGCLSFSGIPGPIFSSRTRIITRTRLLYSGTNLNRIRIAAVGSDLFQVGSQRNRARFKVIGSELFWSGPIENWTQLVGANRICARIVSHRARLPIWGGWGGGGGGGGDLIFGSDWKTSKSITQKRVNIPDSKTNRARINVK